MNKITIIEGNTSDKDNVRNYFVKGEKGEKGDNGEITYSDVVDNLTSTETQKPLSANQGRLLKGLIDNQDLDIDDIREDIDQVKYIFPKSHSYTGDYNIIQVDNKNILIDCSIYENWSEFKAVLDGYSISHIDIFICSHFHPDHIGNFKNLVDNGYIDEDTTIYFPKYTSSLWETDSSYTSPHGYFEAQSTIQANNLTPIQPTEGMEVVLNENTKFTFYNTDDEVSRQIFTQQSYYNNASLIILFKHYDITNAYWGDCYSQPVGWLYNLGYLPENIGIWKMGHHGIDYSGQSAFEILRKLKINYAIEELGRNYLYKGHTYANGTASEMQKLGVPVLVSAYNEKNIEIITRLNLINLLVGTYNLSAEKSRYKTISFYVDPVNYNSTKQDGSQSYPFSNLNQCLGNIDRNNGVSYTINLADGEYNNEFISYDENKDISTLYGMTNKVTIKGNVEDNTAVILHHGFNIKNCSNIVIQDLTIFNGGTKSGFEVDNSNISLENIAYEIDTDTTTSKPNGIYAVNSIISTDNCTFAKCSHSIKAYNSTLYLTDISSSDLTYASLNLSNCIVTAKNCVVSDNSQKLVTYDTERSSFLDGINIWSGELQYDSETAENNTVTMNSKVNIFKNLKIDYYADNISNKQSIIIPITSNTPMARINYLHMNNDYCWLCEVQIDFSDDTLTISSVRQRRITLADSSISSQSTPNMKILSVSGL